MTTVDGTQASNVTEPDSELVNLLVPRRAPRGRTAGIVALVTLVVLAIPVIAYSGAITPNITFSVANTTAHPDHSATVVLHAHNKGRADAHIESMRVRGATEVPGGGRAVPVTVHAGETKDIVMQFDHVNCGAPSDSTKENDISLTARGVLPFSITRDVKLDASTGWIADIADLVCGRN